MADVFISYSRADDEPFVERLYHDLMQHSIEVWWDRKAMKSRGLTFLQEIRDAIEDSDRLIAVITPGALISEYVRVEWEHALLFSKGIIPLLREGEYDTLPPDLRALHTIDFRTTRPYEHVLEELLHVLAEPVSPLGPFRTVVPSLPPHFLACYDDIVRLGEKVLVDVGRPTVITSAMQTITLQGMGGVGKSVLAAAFARAVDVRRAFTDGIIWLTIGLEPNLLQNLQLIGYAFDARPENFVEMQAALAQLPRLLADKVCLIVLDDVWNVEHATLFKNTLGPRCRLLITTRDGGLATVLGAQAHPVDVLTDDAALRLLADWCGWAVDTLALEAVAVANECGNLPFALALCGSLARDGISWSDLLNALQQADLTFIENALPNYAYPDILKSLKISVDVLAREDAAGAQHYLELAVFPPDEAVTENAVLTLWSSENGLNGRNGRKLLTKLERRSLIQLEGEMPNRRVSLHDLLHDYLRAVTSDIVNLHNLFLDAYWRKCPDGWASGPKDGYFFEHLTYHLSKAGRGEELRALLLSIAWLEVKLTASDVSNLILDYDFLPDDEVAATVQDTLRLSADVLAQDKIQLSSQLLGRLGDVEVSAIQALLEQSRRNHSGVWLRPLVPSLTPPGTPLLRTLTGHSAAVRELVLTSKAQRAISSSDDDVLIMWDLDQGRPGLTLKDDADGPIGCAVGGLAVTPDDRCVISESGGKNLKVWELKTGQLVQTLQGDAMIDAIAITHNGQYVISALFNSTLEVWDLRNGQKYRTLTGHSNRVAAVVVTPDDKYVISGSADATVKVWDLENGQLLRTLESHRNGVRGVTLTPDGQRAVSASEDGTLKVWDWRKRKVLLTLRGHSETVTGVAVTPDGGRAVSSSYDNSIKVWDLVSGTEVATLQGHAGGVEALAITSDGKRVVSASIDQTLKVWDLERCHRAYHFDGHTDLVWDIAFTPDGDRVISCSRDGTLILWDIHTCRPLRSWKAHSASVMCVAIAPSSRMAISASDDHTLKVWDLETYQTLHTLAGHSSWVRAVAVTPDGRKAISAGGDEQLKIWDLDSGREVKTMDGCSYLTSKLVLTQNGCRAILASSFEAPGVFNLEDATSYSIPTGRSGEATALAVTPDEKHAVSSANDATVRVWDIETGEEMRVLRGHTDYVSAVAVCPNGRWVVSASEDRSLKLWDLDGQEVITGFFGEAAFFAVAISPDGQTIVAGERTGRVHFLRVEGT